MQRSDQSNKREHGRRYLGIAQRILADVEAGLYAVGDALPPDRTLASEFTVSRGTIREALLALELIGVLEIRQGSGTYVRERWGTVDPGLLHSALDSAPDEVIEARAALEPIVASQACRHASPEALAALRADIEQARRLATHPESLPRFMAMGLQFHADVAALSGNRFLGNFIAQLVDLERHPMWTLLNQQAMRSVEARQKQMQEHTQILDFIENGDEEGVRSMMSHHLIELQEAILGSAYRSPGQRESR